MTDDWERQTLRASNRALREELARLRGSADTPSGDDPQLERLRMLAGGVAHEFNNLLGSVLGNAELLRHDLTGEDLEVASEIAEAARRGAAICANLLAFSGGRGADLRELDLSSALHTMVPGLRRMVRELRPDARLQIDLAELLPAVQADPSQLRRVLENLVTNAAEALPEGGGRIQLATGLGSPSPTPLQGERRTGVREEGAHVWIEVADEGSGMAPEVLERALEPFFSTRFPGRGLGLPAVAGLVRGHCGMLTLRSSSGAGTVARVYLPVHERRALEHAPTEELPRMRLILIAEDEAAVASLIRRILVRAGYAAEVVGSRAEAMAALETKRFDACLMDHSLPGGGGVELLQSLRKVQPGLPAIVTSGYGPEVAEGERFLSKPFRPKELLAALDEVL